MLRRDEYGTSEKETSKEGFESWAREPTNGEEEEREKEREGRGKMQELHETIEK